MMTDMTGRLRTLLLTGALLTGLASTGALAQSTGVDALLQQARYWLEEGRADRANEAFRRVLAIDPDNQEARRGLARTQPQQSATPAPTPPSTPAPTARPSPAPSGARGSRGTSSGSSPTPTPAQQVPLWTAADDRAEGYRYLEQGQLERAAQQFQTALSRRSSDPESLGGLGIVRLRQSRFIEARDLLARASQLGDAEQWADALRSARFYGGLEEARMALASGDLVRAQQTAEALVRSGFEMPAPALVLLAEIYEEQGRYADAADILEQASADDAEEQARLQSRAARNRALLAAQRGNDLLAEDEFISGLMLDPEDPWIRYEFARYLSGRGRVAEVDSMVSAIGRIGTAEALYAAALLSDQRDRPEEAQAFLDRIPDADRTTLVDNLSGKLMVQRQIAYAEDLSEQGQSAQAIAQLRQLADDRSLSAEAKAEVGGALLRMGDKEGAALAARDALSTGGITQAASYEPIIRVLARTGLDTEARTALQNARAISANTIEGQSTVDRLSAILAASRADRLRQEGSYADAFDVLREAWNTSAGNQDILLELALLYESGAMPSQAAQTFQLYLAQDPQSKDALLGLTRTATGAGDYELAEASLERALALAPGDYEVYLAGAGLEQSRGRERRAVAYLERARELYLQQTGILGGQVTASDPFGAAPVNGNPFRNAPPAQPAVDPFNLPSGSRLPVQNVASGAPFGTSPQAPANAGRQTALPPMAGPVPSAGAAGGGMVGGDAVLADINTRIVDLSDEAGATASVIPNYRERSGEEGLSALRTLDAAVEASTPIAGGRISAGVDFVVLDAGQIGRSALARFGRNATIEAQAIVDEVESPLVAAETQHASGIAPFIQYSDDNITARVGSTPIGFEDEDITFHVEARGRVSPEMTGRVWVEGEPVDDSLVAYAGARDPVTGEYWGQVMAMGGGVAFSYDRSGSGVYGDATYRQYDGHSVRDNRSAEINVGGYLLALERERTSLTAGVNLNYQTYSNNQNFFTFGHGGYFSPQGFLAVSFPFNYSYETEQMTLRVEAAPGFQSYEQEEVRLYPTDLFAQAELENLKGENVDVRAHYDSISKTGLAFAGKVTGDFHISPSTTISGVIGYDTFGSYSEFNSLISVTQRFGKTGQLP